MLDDGRVIESGTHAELLAEGGRYEAMLAAQSHQLKEGPGPFTERSYEAVPA